MLENIPVKERLRLFAVIDRVLTSAPVRWTWSDLGAPTIVETLSDHRPSDFETIHEMMAGRYLLASKLVDTNGVSPFSVNVVHTDWNAELHSFSWLRHFRDARDEGERHFACTLALDWIGRYRQFDRFVWGISLTAQRVMNWLRHMDLLTYGATQDQIKTIQRLLGQQVQSLKIREPFAHDAEDILMARIALTGAALCDSNAHDVVPEQFKRLEESLAEQIDADGLHKSRNPALQMQILTELVTLRQALAKRQKLASNGFVALVERMHTALAALTLGTGELVYFNGCGQQPTELIYALQAQGNGQKRPANGVLGGYGMLRAGAAALVADGGRVPALAYAAHAHAGMLSFEFSHGNELVVGNCGPAPAELSDAADLFRLAAAHSAPAIGEHSAATIIPRGVFAGRLVAHDNNPEIVVDGEDSSIYMRNAGFSQQFGVIAERWLNLVAGGDTLVGQDRFSAAFGQIVPAHVVLRFHLGPGAEAVRDADTDMVSIHLPSGKSWNFLWEGAQVYLDESVRQSAHHGFHRTMQIVAEAELSDGAEISWVLTRQD